MATLCEFRCRYGRRATICCVRAKSYEPAFQRGIPAHSNTTRHVREGKLHTVQGVRYAFPSGSRYKTPSSRQFSGAWTAVTVNGDADSPPLRTRSSRCLVHRRKRGLRNRSRVFASAEPCCGDH